MKSIIQYLLLQESQNHYRQNIKIGQTVLIVQKKDQKTNKLTKGTVQKILTSKAKHTRGIKVRLSSGQVGRVQKILS